ncbi:MAG: RelA/SpoT family protein [Bacteroidales bacterium OttesenSCG-928-I14]|jgi:GTP pyrophosphokinase|nr:RelA/SpoT family protein [Bacteroidales bacterium OttesenSCG-928-I14]
MKSIEAEKIQKAYEVLLDSYTGSVHRKKISIIEKAFNFANEAHKGIKRYSGEPFILHPLSVALIVSKEMGLGSTSISAALLHDVVEDTDRTIDDVEFLFGRKIAQIVGGLTKISGGNFSKNVSIQAENMRKLLLTMSSDIRVILVKIADRLHNMRTLCSLPLVKQYKIAGETLYLYAPMAHRLGLFSIKTELENLSFQSEYPREYKQIDEQLKITSHNRGKIYDQFIMPLKEELNKLGYYYKIQKRTKSVYSIWSKMQTKGISFSDIYDIFAVRIIFESDSRYTEKKQCWDIYSIVTDLYQLRPDRLRDWVSHPKANGYQSLHLTVMGPNGQWIEVQIRSFQMDEVAEKGFASHWKYKEQGSDFNFQQNELDLWLEKIRAILRVPTPNAMDFLDTIKLNLYSDEIFVFTPKGDIKTLPQSATVLDFAYEIHSDIGNHCIGAKVNHRLASLSHLLASGDQVEILISESQLPKKEWLNIVTTATAKTKIESTIRKQKKIQIQKGEKLLNNYFALFGIKVDTQSVDKFCDFYGYSKREFLFFALDEKQVQLPKNPYSILKNSIKNFSSVRHSKSVVNSLSSSKELENSFMNNFQKTNKNEIFILKEEEFQKNFIVKSCCRPIPGDEVFGFVRDDGQLEIHKKLCKKAIFLKTHFGNRLILCNWAGHRVSSFIVALELKGIDRIGMLSDIMQVITHDLVINTRKISIVANDGVFEGIIEIFIQNVHDIHTISLKLGKIAGMKSIVRTRN